MVLLSAATATWLFARLVNLENRKKLEYLSGRMTKNDFYGLKLYAGKTMQGSLVFLNAGYARRHILVAVDQLVQNTTN